MKARQGPKKSAQLQVSEKRGANAVEQTVTLSCVLWQYGSDALRKFCAAFLEAFKDWAPEGSLPPHSKCSTKGCHDVDATEGTYGPLCAVTVSSCQGVMLACVPCHHPGTCRSALHGLMAFALAV